MVSKERIDADRSTIIRDDQYHIHHYNSLTFKCPHNGKGAIFLWKMKDSSTKKIKEEDDFDICPFCDFKFEGWYKREKK